MSKSIIYKRPGTPYWYVVGLRITTKTSDRKLALEFAKKALTDAWRREQLGESPRRTWDHLASEWLEAKSYKRSLSVDRQVIERFGHLLRASSVDYVDQIRGEHVRAYLVQTEAKTSASTANRHLNSLRAMLQRAFQNEWIVRIPRCEKFHVLDREPRVLTHQQFETIVANLVRPLDAQIARIAVLTGMRRTNVCGLRWEWFTEDLSSVAIPKVETKAQRTYVTAIPVEAKAILGPLKAASTSPWVFEERGAFRSPPAVSQAWINASIKAGLRQFRFHDLRHTWASRHTRNGTPDRVLQALGGWQDAGMVGQYSHFSVEHLAKYAENGVGGSAQLELDRE